jgi:hypothetical protein
MEWVEEKWKEVKSPCGDQVLAKTSIQNLYQMLGKNVKKANNDSIPLIAIDRRYHLHRP